MVYFFFFFFSSRRRHTRFDCDWSSDVCSSDLEPSPQPAWKQCHQSAGSSRLPSTPGQGRDRSPSDPPGIELRKDRSESTRLNSSHSQISYAVFCLKKKKKINQDSIRERSCVIL